MESNINAEVRTERIITATPQQIFAAFERPEVLAEWWGPEGFTNTFELFEFKPGGRWVFVMHDANGHNYDNESVFNEIERPSRIVIEHVARPWYTLTIKLTPHGDQTKLEWIQEFESADVAAKMRPIVATANEQNLDRLQAVFDTTTA